MYSSIVSSRECVVTCVSLQRYDDYVLMHAVMCDGKSFSHHSRFEVCDRTRCV